MQEYTFQHFYMQHLNKAVKVKFYTSDAYIVDYPISYICVSVTSTNYIQKLLKRVNPYLITAL